MIRGPNDFLHGDEHLSECFYPLEHLENCDCEEQLEAERTRLDDLDFFNDLKRDDL